MTHKVFLQQCVLVCGSLLSCGQTADHCLIEHTVNFSCFSEVEGEENDADRTTSSSSEGCSLNFEKKTN